MAARISLHVHNMVDEPDRSRVPPRHQLGLPLPRQHEGSAAVEEVSQFIRSFLKGRTSPPAPEALLHVRCPACGWLDTRRRRARGRTPTAIDRLLPRVPLRHWVFSLGKSIQPALRTSSRLRAAIARACVRSVFAWLRRAAARAGVFDARACGALTASHRVDAALEPNVHVHALVLDGVYTRHADGTPVFVPVAAPRRRDVRRIAAELRTAIDRLVARASRARPPPERAATVAHRLTVGPVVRPVPPSSAVGLVSRCGTVDLRAGPAVGGDEHNIRARLCRYVAREPFDIRAVSAGHPGRLRYRLHRPFSDGTTHVELTPAALFARLQALCDEGLRPPIAFHGMLAPGAAAAWLPRKKPRQLALLPNTRATAPRSSPGSGLPPSCPRCGTDVEIVGVEPAPTRAA